MSVAASTKPLIDYPDSDGEPMSDSTVQFDWIAILKWNTDWYFRDDPLVFVAGDHLIYTVEGEREIRQAPDVYVVFGRPKGHRGSYKVWEEGNLFPQVVFEVWTPNSTVEKMDAKFKFYEKYGAEEYYIVYPDHPASASGWLRCNHALVPINEMNNFISPRLKFRFSLVDGDIKLYGHNNREFRTPLQMIAGSTADKQLAKDANQLRFDVESQRADRLADKLRELGVDPNAS